MNISFALWFPILAVAGLLCFFAYYVYALTPRKGTLEWIARARTGQRRRFTFTAPLHPMEKKDALPLLLLTAVYAVTAFWSLGSTCAPESWLHLENGEYVTFSSPATFSLGRVEYYTGLWTGSYDLEFSGDGVTWQQVELEQDYAHLFYWREAELPEGELSARYFRLTAVCADQIELGELALFDADGNRVDLTPDEGAQALFDEQDQVPDAPHWTNSAYFDEIYHARTALEHLRGVTPYENSHPPLGKLILSLGIALFGMTPFGWRFMGTLCGVLMVPLLYVFLKNLFGKTPVALCGTALFAFDFMHLTQTRIATIDSYGVFFILAMYFFLYRFLALPAGAPWRKCALPLLLSGLMFGLGVASKWIVVYGGVGLAVLYFLGLFWKCRDWPGGEDAPSKPRWLAGTLLFSVVCFVVLPGAIYLASYLPIAYADKVTGWKDFWSLVWNNQVFMLTYHKGVDTPHPYSSRWYQWLLDIRPILYYMVNETEAGFTTRFAAFNSPVVAWGGLAALVVTAVQTVRRRCGKGLLILVGYLAQLLPWVFISRITFAYHYFPCILFLSLALAYVFNDLVESGRRWRGAVYGLTGGAAGLYALFYPALIGLRVPTWFMKCFIKWFPSWPF
jgi:4-amino-4-deoxy-L-arabinose transferase-like glycosyltransferase